MIIAHKHNPPPPQNNSIGENMKIDILGIEYEVTEHEAIDANDDLLGQIDYTAQTISIKKGMPEEKKRAVLLHEIVHGISEASGLSLDEKTVQILSRILYSVFKTNRAVFTKQEDSLGEYTSIKVETDDNSSISIATISPKEMIAAEGYRIRLTPKYND